MLGGDGLGEISILQAMIGNNIIMVLIDEHSKWIEAISMFVLLFVLTNKFPISD